MKDICEACGGAGSWEAECCNGSGGCSCRGQRIDMGRCAACGGTGRSDVPGYSPSANLNTIRGYGFIGSGPAPGTIFDSMPRMFR